MQDIKLKVTHRHREQYGGYRRGGGGGAVKDNGGQIYGDGRRSDFGWWAHNAIYRSCIIEMYP